MRILKSVRLQRGLTLIEVLVIIAVLGLLATIIIPNVGRFTKTGNLAAANTELQNVVTAAKGYFAKSAAWPDNSNLPAFTPFYSGSLRAIYYFDVANDGTGPGEGLVERADTAPVPNPWPNDIHFYSDTQRWEKTRP